MSTPKTATSQDRTLSNEATSLSERVRASAVEQNEHLDLGVSHVKELIQSLAQTARQAGLLAVAGDETASSTNEIAASVEQMTGNLAAVATAATQTATAIKQIA